MGCGIMSRKIGRMVALWILLITMVMFQAYVGEVRAWAGVPTHSELAEDAFDSLPKSESQAFAPHYKWIAAYYAIWPDVKDTGNGFYYHWYNPDLPLNDGSPPPENGGAIIRSRERYEEVMV